MTLAANTRRLAGVVFITLLLTACATPPQTRELLAAPPTTLPDRVELTQTPFYPQQQYQCGPAALATVLAAHAVTVTPEALADAMYVPALQGSLPEEITATARRYRMLAYPLSASLEALLIEVARGNPVLVMQNLGTRWYRNWHFAVVIGYDLEGREIILRSGTTRRWRTTLATFERTWARSGHWALVILPAGEVPATADITHYLQAAHDLEASSQPAAARSAYRAATQHWPEHPQAWMTWGNSLYAGGETGAAEGAFRQVTRLSPHSPRGWNNLAYVLLQAGCPQQAQRAAACAIRFGDKDPEFQDTFAEIQSLAEGADKPQCVPVDC